HHHSPKVGNASSMASPASTEASTAGQRRALVGAGSGVGAVATSTVVTAPIVSDVPETGIGARPERARPGPPGPIQAGTADCGPPRPSDRPTASWLLAAARCLLAARPPLPYPPCGRCPAPSRRPPPADLAPTRRPGWSPRANGPRDGAYSTAPEVGLIDGTRSPPDAVNR